MIETLCRALAGDLLVLAQDGGQLQLLEVVTEQDLRCLVGRRGHGAPVSVM